MSENTNKKPKRLIPQAETWIDNDLNVLLVGLHGVGKTYSIEDICQERNLNYKYYSCSTLDPFTDLVGVPDPVTADDGSRHLEMVRPKDIDEAEVVVFDELNRADDKVLNAVFEIIQFRRINGEPLPKLKAVWAAINPPGQNYSVNDLDPALIDRFDVFYEVTPKPSVTYMESKGIRKPVAQALVKWWNDINANKRDSAEFISPRRLEKIGLLYEKTGDCEAAIPGWFSVDKSKLKSLLADVENRAKIAKENGGKMPHGQFRYDADSLADDAYPVTEYLADNQADLVTHKAVADAIEGCQAPRMIRDHAHLLEALVPSIREGLLANMSDSKFARLVKEVEGMEDYRKLSHPKLVASVKAAQTTRG